MIVASTGNFFASKPTLARTCSESTVTEYVHVVVDKYKITMCSFLDILYDLLRLHIISCNYT